jgi:hypothetical protein
MKKALPIILVALTTLAAIPCVAQKRENAVAPPIAPTNSAVTTDPLSSFQLVVKKFTVFFSAGPRKLIFKASYHDAKFFRVNAFSGRNIAYDVQKTNSLVSPYLATIQIKLIDKDNSFCGDVKSPGGGINEFSLGWSTINGAISAIDRPECYIPDQFSMEHIVKFVFAFQEGQWAFTDVVDVNTTATAPTLRPLFMSIFGDGAYPVTRFSEPGAQALNSTWRDLVQN